MNEIEKMYENAGIKRRCSLWSRILEMPTTQICEGICDDEELCSYCLYGPHKNAYYPPFTAEKQLELIKFLLNKSVYYDTYGDREYWFHLSDEIQNSKYREFDEAIAECINKMWEDLRDYEKQQIKEILEK